jgi:hypothetical protein
MQKLERRSFGATRRWLIHIAFSRDFLGPGRPRQQTGKCATSQPKAGQLEMFRTVPPLLMNFQRYGLNETVTPSLCACLVDAAPPANPTSRAIDAGPCWRCWMPRRAIALRSARKWPFICDLRWCYRKAPDRVQDISPRSDQSYAMISVLTLKQTKSISTSAPRPRADTPIVVLAGRGRSWSKWRT